MGIAAQTMVVAVNHETGPFVAVELCALPNHSKCNPGLGTADESAGCGSASCCTCD